MRRPFAGRVALAAAVIFVTSLLMLMRTRAARPELPRLGEVPDFHFTNQLGEPFSRANLDGKLWVADFIFTSCPEICPRMTEEMAKLATYLDNRALPVQLVSISVDPARDTPEKLRAYAEHFHARPGRWTFLTGPVQAVEDAVVHGFKQTMSREKDPAQQDNFTILHGTRFVIVDGKRQIRGYYDPNDGEAMARLRRDLSALAEHGG